MFEGANYQSILLPILLEGMIHCCHEAGDWSCWENKTLKHWSYKSSSLFGCISVGVAFELKRVTVKLISLALCPAKQYSMLDLYSRLPTKYPSVFVVFIDVWDPENYQSDIVSDSTMVLSLCQFDDTPSPKTVLLTYCVLRNEYTSKKIWTLTIK